MNKISTYEEFLRMEPKPMSFEEANKVYHMILAARPAEDYREFDDLLDEMVKRAVAYAGARAQWAHMTLEEKMANNAAADAERSRKHDLFIKAQNKLVEYMYDNKLGDYFEVMDLIGEERKRVGDFACYLAYVYSLNER